MVFLGEQKGGGEELALKKMDTGKLDAEDIEIVTILTSDPVLDPILRRHLPHVLSKIAQVDPPCPSATVAATLHFNSPFRWLVRCGRRFSSFRI